MALKFLSEMIPGETIFRSPVRGNKRSIYFLPEE